MLVLFVTIDVGVLVVLLNVISLRNPIDLMAHSLDRDLDFERLHDNFDLFDFLGDHDLLVVHVSRGHLDRVLLRLHHRVVNVLRDIALRALVNLLALEGRLVACFDWAVASFFALAGAVGNSGVAGRNLNCFPHLPAVCLLLKNGLRLLTGDHAGSLLVVHHSLLLGDVLRDHHNSLDTRFHWAHVNSPFELGCLDFFQVGSVPDVVPAVLVSDLFLWEGWSASTVLLAYAAAGG